MSQISERINEAAVNYYTENAVAPTTVFLSVSAAVEFLTEMAAVRRYTLANEIKDPPITHCTYWSAVGPLHFEIISGDVPENFITCDRQAYDRYLDEIVARNMLG